MYCVDGACRLLPLLLNFFSVNSWNFGQLAVAVGSARVDLRALNAWGARKCCPEVDGGIPVSALTLNTIDPCVLNHDLFTSSLKKLKFCLQEKKCREAVEEDDHLIEVDIRIIIVSVIFTT